MTKEEIIQSIEYLKYQIEYTRELIKECGSSVLLSDFRAGWSIELSMLEGAKFYYINELKQLSK